jgi:membrane associated rhomboid family serine protease
MSALPPPPPPSSDVPVQSFNEVPCDWHSKRLTGRQCTRCGRPACSDCLVQASVGAHCPACRKAAAPTLRQQVSFVSSAEHSLVTKALIGVNGLIFIIGLIMDKGFPDSVLRNRVALNLATYGPAVRDGEVWRVVSGGFLHYGPIHIAFNMWLLYQVGGFLERTLGRLNFALLYFASLVGGSLGAMVLNADGFHGGASGAVFGLMGAFTIAFMQRGVKLTQTPLFVTLVLNLVITFGSGFAGGSISVGGHLGGLLAGGIVGAVMLRPARPRVDSMGRAVAAAAIVIASAMTLIAVRADNSPNVVPIAREQLRQQNP